jgi:hypothetical protein
MGLGVDVDPQRGGRLNQHSGCPPHVTGVRADAGGHDGAGGLKQPRRPVAWEQCHVEQAVVYRRAWRDVDGAGVERHVGGDGQAQRRRQAPVVAADDRLHGLRRQRRPGGHHAERRGPERLFQVRMPLLRGEGRLGVEASPRPEQEVPLAGGGPSEAHVDLHDAPAR